MKIKQQKIDAYIKYACAVVKAILYYFRGNIVPAVVCVRV